MLIISKPKVTEEADTICVSSRVVVEDAAYRFPQTLWFRFPKEYAPYVTGRSDGFAVALLPVAMAMGVPLRIRGAVSPRLLRGLEKYRSIQAAWKPSPFQAIEISADVLAPADSEPVAGGVGCTFSGGVDSFYTLRRHLPSNEPNPRYRISHCVMINGFDQDMDLTAGGGFGRIERVYESLMKRLGLQLLVTQTNIREFIDRRVLKQSFAAIVTTPALILGRLFSCFLVASSYRFDEFFRDGSHPLIDHLISTESLETVHDAGNVTRLQKTALIAGWQETYSTLRVCAWQTTVGKESGIIENCCRCEKCVRTMAALDLYGCLPRYSVFPKPLRSRDIRRCAYDYRGARLFAWELMKYALQTRRIDTLRDFGIAILRSQASKAGLAPFRWVHLQIEARCPAYERTARRIYPRLQQKPEQRYGVTRRQGVGKA